MAIASESTLIRDLPEMPLPSKSPELSAIASYVRAGRCALFVGAGLSVTAGLPTWEGLMRRLIAATTPAAIDPKTFAKMRHFSLVARAEKARSDPLLTAVEKKLGRVAFEAIVARRLKADAQSAADSNTYLNVLAEVHADSHERTELERLLEAGRNQDVAARCRNALGRERFFEAVKTALSTSAPLPPTHREIARTPFACVVTTNFDDLLERAYVKYTGNRPPAPTAAELDRHGDLLLRSVFFILKAHGDLAAPDSLVFTADDYRRIVHANPAFQAMMSGILMTHAIVFVGYSLNDVNFRLLLDGQLTTFRGRVPPRFAVMNGVGPAERETMWRTARLRVLPYPKGKHKEVGAFLTALANAATGGHEPPRSARTRTGQAASLARPLHVLTIGSNGERMQLELRTESAGRANRSLWVGSTTWRGFEALRQRVVETFEPAYSGAQFNRRIERAGAALSSLLPPDLRAALARLGKRATLELAPTLAAEPIPWEWARVGESFLGLRTAVVRRSAEFSRGARGQRRLNRPLRALILGYAGSGDGRGVGTLPMAEQEADHAARLLSSRLGAQVTRLSGADAKASTFLSALADGNYDIVHFAGHAWAAPEDAYLVLWDRLVLGTEIGPLLSRRPPALLVMSTHHTAFFPLDLDRNIWISPVQLAAPEQHGEPTEDRGFTALAMRCGVTSFVGACGSVSDAGSKLVMVAFYERLVRGDTTPQALRAARESALDQGDLSGLQFVAIGEAAFRLAGPRSSKRVRGRGSRTT